MPGRPASLPTITGALRSRRTDWDAHRPLREDEDLGLIFTFREKRKVSHVLTLPLLSLVSSTAINALLTPTHLKTSKC